MRLDLELTTVQALAAATPLALAGIGELVAERAGVINIGIEGLMATGAIAASAAGAASGNAWLAVAAAILAALLLGAVFASATVLARVDQIVCGMAINLMALGASATLWAVLQAHDLDRLPGQAGFEPLLGGVYGLTGVGVVLALAVAAMLRWSRAGIIIRALGDAPEACEAAGISVRRWRFVLVVLAAGLAGLAGSFFSIMRVHQYTPGTTGGSGFLALALVIFGRWRVWGLLAGCLFFGVLGSLELQMQADALNRMVPHQVLQCLPYLASLLALAALSRSAPGPVQLGQPFPERR